MTTYATNAQYAFAPGTGGTTTPLRAGFGAAGTKGRRPSTVRMATAGRTSARPRARQAFVDVEDADGPVPMAT